MGMRINAFETKHEAVTWIKENKKYFQKMKIKETQKGFFAIIVDPVSYERYTTRKYNERISNMQTCPQCIGERDEVTKKLISTIKFNKAEGYYYCTKCGRRWPIKK